MIRVAKEWNPKQFSLRKLLPKPEKFDEAIRLCLQMHSLVHNSKVSRCNHTTYEDKLWDGLAEEVFRAILAIKKTTIAWNLWHITRIEDIVANILIADGEQILNNDWLRSLNTTIRDTGNAMTAEEIVDFSNTIVMKELRKYRTAVGRKTREIIGQLKVTDLKRKMRSIQLKRIIDEEAVLEIKGSRWLVDFWGKKTVTGLLLMPITRHQIVHLNTAFKIKERCLKTSRNMCK
ncbi:MAG: DinB family protein [Candidatus Bathyarchaeota archaeon]|nr:MAG: DinB family protein [Candidatus Bathyarchaeota archaeon]